MRSLRAVVSDRSGGAAEDGVLRGVPTSPDELSTHERERLVGAPRASGPTEGAGVFFRLKKRVEQDGLAVRPVGLWMHAGCRHNLLWPKCLGRFRSVDAPTLACRLATTGDDRRRRRGSAVRAGHAGRSQSGADRAPMHRLFTARPTARHTGHDPTIPCFPALLLVVRVVGPSAGSAAALWLTGEGVEAQEVAATSVATRSSGR